MPRSRFVALAVAPLVATALLFVAVLRSGSPPAPLARTAIPQEPYAADRCSWWCHNHGCRHRPVLPAALTGDAGLFGWTVRALHAVGRAVAPRSPALGYGAANLAVFCVLWPGTMYALWIVALRQRSRISASRRAAERERLEQAP
jgi:hypothetical protein